MAYMPMPEQDEPDTTYRSQGLHTNRDSTAKMQLAPTDRSGAPIPEEVAPDEPEMVVPSDEPTESIGVGERAVIGSGNKDLTQEHSKGVNKASASLISEVTPGQYLPPVPGGGTQASYGDGQPQGSGGGMNVDVNFSYEGGEGGQGFSMGGGGGGSSMGGSMASMGAAQLGQDIAAMDDTMDQAEEQMFQDDRVRIQMERLAEKQQGR